MSKKQPKQGDKIDIKKLRDPQVVLHPKIFTWRNNLTVDTLLLNSLKEGQIQPIIFRKLKNDKFELLVGSRRYFHQKILGTAWEDIPKEIRENVSERQALLMAASENIFREDFSPWEEARAINDLLSVMSVKEVAKYLDKSESHVISRRALLSLPEKIQKRFEKNNIPIGYASTIKKLTKFPEAQDDLLEKIEGANDRYYHSGIDTVEEAEEYVSKILKRIKQIEKLVAAYGVCPKCGSKDIKQSGWGDGAQLTCNDCSHSWHKDTKEPWQYYETKQKLESMGIAIEETAGKVKLTPKDVKDLMEKEDRKHRESDEGEDEIPEKFRSKVPLETIILPMLNENIQKVSVAGNNIEIELIEDSGLHFKGLKKDYRTGEKARIEITYGYGKTTQEIAKQVHEILNQLT